MGKKRIATTDQKSDVDVGGAKKSSKRRTLNFAVLYVNSTYNNTTLSVADEKGNIVACVS